MNVDTTVEKMTVKQAESIVHTLSNPSKLVGRAWGISPYLCRRGSKLIGKEDTVCSACYACKGHYVFDKTKVAHAKRLKAFLETPRQEWIAAMSCLIKRKCKEPFFRVFDSGDLQSEGMLEAWFDVAEITPVISFWLSTREHGIVKRVLRRRKQPDNMVIRNSADFIDGSVPIGFKNTSGVSSEESLVEWKNRFNNMKVHDDFPCPAPLQGNNCKACRACWDKEVRTVIYKRH